MLRVADRGSARDPCNDVALGGHRARSQVVGPAVEGYFFFFSSRRRHTRSKRDWSSDVCSSDLPSGCRPTTRRGCRRARRSSVGRSEERRVGKECRSRGGPCDQKKNEDTEPGGQVTEIVEGRAAGERIANGFRVLTADGRQAV